MKVWVKCKVGGLNVSMIECDDDDDDDDDDGISSSVNDSMSVSMSDGVR